MGVCYVDQCIAMAARNPGPTLNKEPLGFPTYHNKCKRDYLSRRLFLESEVNTRIYKNIYHNLGLKGAIPIDSKVIDVYFFNIIHLKNIINYTK